MKKTVLLDFSGTGKQPTFLEWLLERYNTTPRKLYEINQQTGTNREYQKMMEWYRNRYHQEMEIREALIAANPFQKQEEK